MGDEIMTIEGFDEGPGRHKMAHMSLAGFKDDLLDKKAWVDGFKASAGGAAGILVTALAVDKLPVIKNQSPMVKGIAQGALGIVLYAGLRKKIGDAAAHGLAGGAGGLAIARIVSGFLPEAIRPNLSQYTDEDVSQLSPEERDFLNQLPGEGLDQVSVETAGLDQVSVETAQLAEGDDDVYGLDGLGATQIAAVA